MGEKDFVEDVPSDEKVAAPSDEKVADATAQHRPSVAGTTEGALNVIENPLRVRKLPSPTASRSTH